VVGLETNFDIFCLYRNFSLNFHIKMDSLTPRDNGLLQDRINRMNAWKEQQRRADEDFIKKQKIRMFM
jgi:hypothetical protein